MLKSTISGFLKESPSRTFRVITAAPLDKDSENMVSELTEFYPRQFSVRTLEKGKFTESPNFLFGDDFASRYEDNDRDAKLGLVSAVVNFGNKSRVNNMRAMFARIEQYVEKG